MKTESITRHLRCILTEKELLEVSKQSAELTRAIVALEDDKGRISKDFTARIAEKEAARSVLTDKVLSGYEFRNVPCTVRLNDPKVGCKTVIRDDTLEQVAVEQMTPDEMQEELPLEEAPVEPTAALSHDDEIDETAREALISYSVKSDGFRNAIDGANLGTLRSVHAHLVEDKVGGQRRARIEEQLAKLEAASAESAQPAEMEDAIWDDDGLCQNPINLTVAGPGLVTFALSAAKAPGSSDIPWRRGFTVKDIEPEADMMCDQFNGYGFETAGEAFACAFQDVLAHFEKGKAHGVREYAVTCRAITAKGVQGRIIDAAVAAVNAGKSATLDLASK
jgi:hypothetical protein